MPRKRWLTHLSISNIPVINPEDRNAVEDHDLVRHALVDFEEAAVLSNETREELVVDLVKSIRFARGGIKAGKHGLSDKASAQQIFMSDVRRALERAALPVKRWRKKHDGGGGESFYFQLARAVADVSGITLPKDLKLTAQRAMQHKYGAMSPAMKAAQDAELLAAWRQHLDQLALCLRAAMTAEMAARQQRLDQLALRPKAATPKVQG
jgi:hypothetical protein